MAEHDRQERTDHLEATIHSIESLQQTGRLSLERAKGGVRETAHLVFLQGQVIEATAGSRVGQDALDWVITWGSCRYIFDVKFPSEIVVSPQPLSPTPDEERPMPSPLSAFISQVVQRYTHAPDSAQVTEELTLEEPTRGTAFNSPLPPPKPPIPATYPFSPSTPIPPVLRQQVEVVRPRAPFRLFDGSEVVSYMEGCRLSRTHRHVFFLLDGQRTVVDVVRLTGRSFYEIQRLLTDLERLGLIGMEHTPIGESINGM